MDILRNTFRGAVAALAAAGVTIGLAVGALALIGAPLTWSFVAAVVTAAVGGSATLTSSLDTGMLPVELRGSVDLVPLGVAVPAALVFCVLLLGSLRTAPRILAVRAAGAAGTAAALLATLSTAGDATLDVTLPVGTARLPREAALTLHPDTGSAVVTGVVAVVVLSGACALLTRLPSRRVAAAVALAGPAVLIGGGLAAALFVAPARPALAGVTVLFGANAALLALLAAVGAPTPASLGGPLAPALGDAAGRNDWLLGESAPPLLRLVVLGIFVLLCAAAAALSAVADRSGRSPGPAVRRERPGLRALSSGAVLAVVLAATSLAGSGHLDLGLSLAVFRSTVLDVTLAPGVGWALLTGAVGGALAGLAGGLTTDVRWPARRPRVPA